MGKFWYRALVNAKDTRNVTYHDSIKTTPHYFIHAEPKNLSKFRAFGCRAYPYLNEDRQEKGKHIPRAVVGVNLGFFQESSGYVIYTPFSQKVIVTNHVRFDESYFPYRKQSVIDGHVKERLENQLRVDSPVTWEP